MSKYDKSAVLKHYVTHLPSLLNRDYILDLFTIPEHRSVEVIDGKYYVQSKVDPHPGQLLLQGDQFVQITEVVRAGNENYWELLVSPVGFGPRNDHQPLLKVDDEVTLNPGDIANYPEGPVMVTTVGRVLINYISFVCPFGDLIPYINETISNIGSVEKKIAALIAARKVTAAQANMCTTYQSYIAGFLEFVTPGITKEVLTIPDHIVKRKYELLKIHEKDLANGVPSTMIAIERELVGMFKDYLKGNPAMIYLRKGNFFSNIIKRFFITLGTTEEFGNRGTFNFLPNSLEEGWTTESFAIQANEIRSASQGRSMEVAKGGDSSNRIKRVFQNTAIRENDCKTTRYLPVHLHDKNTSEYIHRYALVGTRLVLITDENYKSFIGKNLMIRSSACCRTPNNNYCYTCMGELYKATGQDKVAAVMNEIGGQMSQKSMKAMHDTTKKTHVLGDLDQYIFHGTL